MAKAKYTESEGVVFIQCPGCKTHHGIATTKPFENGAVWRFNDNLESPTFQPSLLVKSGKYVDPNFDDEGFQDFNVICHSFIRDGKIQFLSDCTHELKGQTVELPDIN